MFPSISGRGALSFGPLGAAGDPLDAAVAAAARRAERRGASTIRGRSEELLARRVSFATLSESSSRVCKKDNKNRFQSKTYW